MGNASFEEIAAQIVKSVVEARGHAISSNNLDAGWKERLIKTFLSDEAVVSLYQKVKKAVDEN